MLSRAKASKTSRMRALYPTSYQNCLVRLRANAHRQRTVRRMASRYATQPLSEILILSDQQRSLLQRALTEWHNHALFTDDDVLQVKAVVRQIFNLPCDAPLVGSSVPDAIILQTATAAQTMSCFCVLMRDETDPNEWSALELESEASIVFPKTTPFKTVLYFLSNSTNGLTRVAKRWPVIA